MRGARLNLELEMTANVDTISGRISEHCYNDSIMSPPTNHGREQFVIDGKSFFVEYTILNVQLISCRS